MRRFRAGRPRSSPMPPGWPRSGAISTLRYSFTRLRGRCSASWPPRSTGTRRRSYASSGSPGHRARRPPPISSRPVCARPTGCAGLVGTVGIRIDGRDQPSALTTPEAPDLQALLAVMVEQGVDTVVMEVSSHALTLGRVDGVRFAVGGFTNLSRDHLDFHPTMQDYFDAKAQLFDPESATHASISVVCIDDDAGRAIAALAHHPVSVSATGQDADWRVEDVRTIGVGSEGAQEFLAVDPAGVHHGLRIGLPGRYNVANCLLAVALLDAVGVSPEQAAPGLRTATGSRAPGTRRPRAVVSRAGRLRAQARRAAGRAADAAGAGRRAAGRGVRRRRQPGSGQARTDGPGRGRTGRPRRGHRRQPSRRGAGGDPGGDRRGHRRTAQPRSSRSATVARPSTSRSRGRNPAISCSSRERATSRGRPAAA